MEEPCRTECREELYWNTFLIQLVPLNLLCSPTIRIILDHFAPGCENSCVLILENVATYPVDDFAVESVMTSDRDRCGEEFCEPPIDFDGNTSQVLDGVE